MKTDPFPTPDGLHDAHAYGIRIRGHLSPRLIARVGPYDAHHQPDGTTCITVREADQAALHGLLRRIRDLGLPLIAVVPAACEDDEAEVDP